MCKPVDPCLDSPFTSPMMMQGQDYWSNMNMNMNMNNPCMLIDPFGDVNSNPFK